MIGTSDYLWVQRVLVWAVIGMLCLDVAVDAMPAPSTDPVALCPNWDTIYVMDAHWDSAKRTKRVTRIIHAPCGDTTAVTPGYLK